MRLEKPLSWPHGKRKLRGNMAVIAHNPWRRIGLRAIILATLGALVLAAAARADTSASEVPVVEASPPTSETVLSGPTPTPTPEAVLSGAGGEATPPASETVQSGPAPTPPASETVPSGPTPTPPASETAQSGPTPAPAPVAPETVLSVPSQATAPETLLSGTSVGKVQETVPVGGAADAQGNSLLAVPTAGGPSEPPGGLGVAAVGPPEIPTASSAGPPSVGGITPMSVVQRDRQFNCELLGEHSASSCSAGWLSAQRVVAEAPMGLTTTAASVAAAAGSPPPGSHGGGGSGSPPVSPAPGPAPAPSGASGSATGSSGIALSGFLTLAGLLLLGAPRAMRRLRLSCQPWRTACFVLIPERPG